MNGGGSQWQHNAMERQLQWNLQEKVNIENVYVGNYVDIHQDGTNFSYRDIQQSGLQTPRLFYEKTGLGLRVPSEDFSVQDVKRCVGTTRSVDVLDVASQHSTIMRMRDWCRYYNETNHQPVCCVNWLEFSNTKLEHYVESPTVVRQADWFERAWPLYLRSGSNVNGPHWDMSEDANAMFGAAAEQQMLVTFPKVRKFVQMSVAGSYVDWSVGIGGASQWLHVLRGSLILWLIPPHEEVLKLFEKWLSTPTKNQIFFADRVLQHSVGGVISQCQRIRLPQGSTLLIPSGWLVASYWIEDGIAFSGYFLHSFAVGQQLRIWNLEECVKCHTWIPRYPFYTDLYWYVLARYVACLLGAEHVAPFTNGQNPLSREYSVSPHVMNSYNVDKKTFYPNSRENDMSLAAAEAALDDHMELVAARNEGLVVDRATDSRWLNLTAIEWNSLVKMITWLKTHPNSLGIYKIPGDIAPQVTGLLSHLRLTLRLHSKDPPVECITGAPILKWPPGAEKATRLPRADNQAGARRGPSGGKSTNSSITMSPGGNFSFGPDDLGPKRRRIRCRTCEPCRRSNCRECLFCYDMAKYGGSGTMKQCCIQKQCLGPILPSSAVCDICMESHHATDAEKEADDYNMETDIYECGICWEIAHPRCLRQRLLAEGNYDPNVEGVILTDLPNYWECVRCVREGKQGAAKSRVPKGLQMLRRVEQDAADGDSTGLVPHNYGTRHASALANIAGSSEQSAHTPGTRQQARMFSWENGTPTGRVNNSRSQREPSGRRGNGQNVAPNDTSSSMRGGGRFSDATSAVRSSRPALGLRDTWMMECVVDVDISSSDEEKEQEVAEYRRMLNNALEPPFWSKQVLKGNEDLRGFRYRSRSGRRPPLLLHRSEATRTALMRQRLIQQCALMNAAINGASASKMNPEDLLLMYEEEGARATSTNTPGATRARQSGMSSANRPPAGPKPKANKPLSVIVTIHKEEDEEEMDDIPSIRSSRRDVSKPKRFMK